MLAMRVIVMGLALGGLTEVNRRSALVMSPGVIGFGERRRQATFPCGREEERLAR